MTKEEVDILINDYPGVLIRTNSMRYKDKRMDLVALWEKAFTEYNAFNKKNLSKRCSPCYGKVLVWCKHNYENKR